MIGLMFSAGGLRGAASFKPSGGGGPTTTPSWIAVGTADTTGTAGSTPAYGTNASGDLFVLIIGGRITSVTTPSGWTLQRGPNDMGGRKCYIYTRDTRSTGSESGTVSVTLSADSQISTIHTFRNVATSSFVENAVHAGTAANGSVLNGPTIGAVGGNNRLALFAVASGDQHVYSAVTGMSGGTWVQRATATTGTGSNSAYALQTAALDTGGTISGGSVSVTSPNNIDEHSISGFALVGV